MRSGPICGRYFSFCWVSSRFLYNVLIVYISFMLFCQSLCQASNDTSPSMIQQRLDSDRRIQKLTLSEIWETRNFTGYHVYPVHGSTVYPEYVAVPKTVGSASFVHLRKDDVNLLSQQMNPESVLAYTYLEDEFYILNVREESGDYVVKMEMSLDELHVEADKMTGIRADPLFISADRSGQKFSAVWKRKPRRLRHFIILSQPLKQMDSVQRNMTKNGYFPDCWQVFVRNKTTMVLSIWRKGFGIRYQIQEGDLLNEMTNYMSKSSLQPALFASKPRMSSRENKEFWIIWRGSEFTWRNREIPRSYGVSSREWGDVESLIESHMRKFELPSINIHISKAGQTRFSTAYGFSDLLLKKRALPTNRYRIASISKTLTAMAIAKLISQGKLSMRTLVFGKRGILNSFEVHPFLQQMTIGHLMEHSSGGWSHLLQREFDRIETSQIDFLQFLVQSYVPINVPGQAFVYSNIGYVFLGRIIEKVSGETYEDFVRHNILWPLNTDARIGGNTSGEDEVMYYSHDNANPYEHWNPYLLDSAAGWVFRAEDLAKLFQHLESGRNNEYVILTLRNRLSASHGLGIQIDSSGGLYHLGSLTGVEAIAYTHNDIQVVIFTNERDRQHNVHTGWMLLLCQHIVRIIELGLA